MDTTCSKVRKSALRIVINHGCQKHFWRTISAGRVLGVKGRRVLILYLSLFWCYSKPPTHLIHIWAQTPPLVTLSTSWHIFYLIKSTTHNYKMNQHKPFIPHLSPSLTGPSFSDFPSGLPVPARRLPITRPGISQKCPEFVFSANVSPKVSNFPRESFLISLLMLSMGS